MTTTRAYAVLELSSSAYHEIRKALEEAGYSGNFINDGAKTRMRVCQPNASRAAQAGPGSCYPGGQHCNGYCTNKADHPKEWLEDSYVIDMHGIAIKERP